MTSILDNMKYLPKGLAVRIEHECSCTKGTLLHQWGDLYIQSNAKVRHIRHAWNSFLIYTTSPDKSNLRALSLEEILGHIYLDKEGKTSLRQVLSWSIDQIKSCGNTPCPSAVAVATATPECTATCPPPTATATCSPPECSEPPCPQMSEELQRLERIHLSSILDSTMMVRVEVEKRGVLEAELQPDGTFSYDDGEVGFQGLNSFELLWYYRRRFPAENDPLMDLDAWIDLDSEFALHRIHFHSDTKSLAAHIKEMFADIPPLMVIGSEDADATSDPDPLCLFMARLEDKEAIYRRELRMLTAIEEKQRVVKDLEAQVALMRTRVGI